MQACELALQLLRSSALVDSKGRLTLAGLATAAALRKGASVAKGRSTLRPTKAAVAAVADPERLAA
ncbi:MAG TPA: hypothetical protein VL137_10920 [Polyangiaceae bacterium]|nr:hypothetical protein [Polyangiaceae bacterium]